MSVSVSITIKGEELTPIVCEAEPRDVNVVSEEAKVSNTSYGYSGRHDHGSLPELKSEGPMARLVASLEDAKRETDQAMTEVINREKEAVAAPDTKKPRLDDKEED